ncbi:MAG: vWA domain-containing protein [Bacteroidota bacterium]
MADLSSPDNNGDNVIEPGVITAGEWNDSKNWDFWLSLYSQNEDLSVAVSRWEIDAYHRYPVTLLDQNGNSIVNAEVSLLDDNGATMWQSKTDNSGQVDLWAQLLTFQSTESQIRVRQNGELMLLQPLTGLTDTVQVITANTSVGNQRKVQIMFTIDATGSMGDELEYLKVELEDVIIRVHNNLTGLEIETGAMVYRDEGDDYVTKFSPLSSNVNDVLTFLNDQSADGGGDNEEAVHTALEESLSYNPWDSTAVARLLFLVLDAPPHENKDVVQSIQASVEKAAGMGIKIIPVTASGIDKPTEFLMRLIALATNGTYVFITNHSGVGEEKIEPTVGQYEVEFLNDLLTRLITKYSE